MNSRSVRDATFAFIDVETTGIDPGQDRVVEVACLVVRENAVLASFNSLVNPERTIPAVASAVHHLTAAHVAAAPRLDALIARLREICAGAVIVAHNARFDLAFLPFLAARPVLCSMRFAMHVVHDAPNYQNQVLRYHLGLAPAALGAVAAHRALADVIVTAELFAVCLQRYFAAGGVDDIESLGAYIQAPRRFAALHFGRHRGTPLADVPAPYLQWLLRAANISDDVRYTARRELDRRNDRAA
jgi:DNA polymerase-3 subunit epsilon